MTTRRGFLAAPLAAGLGVSILAAAPAAQAQTGVLDRAQLKDFLVSAGYAVSDLDSTPGKEKYSFTVQQGGLNIPVAAELSPNGRYVWLTVFCKQGPPTGDQSTALLSQNRQIQPAQFYLTSTQKIMLGLPLRNRGLTTAELNEGAQRIVSLVVSTKADWQ
jgi:hypothetical protein